MWSKQFLYIHFISFRDCLDQAINRSAKKLYIFISTEHKHHGSFRFTQTANERCEQYLFFIRHPRHQYLFYFLQSMRLKIISATGSAERRFSSWIGGSILASLVSDKKSFTRTADVFSWNWQGYNIVRTNCENRLWKPQKSCSLCNLWELKRYNCVWKEWR